MLSRSFIFIVGFVLLSILISNKIKKANTNYLNSFLVNIIFFSFVYVISIQVINSVRTDKFFNPDFVYSQEVKEIKKKNLNKLVEADMIAEREIVRNNLISKREDENSITFKEKIYNNFRTISILIQRRFVGFESLAIVTSSNRQSKEAFWGSLKEEVNINHHQSYYSTKFMSPKHRNFIRGSSRQVSVFLPGVIAFFSYYGSLVFLFISLLLIHSFSGFVEKIAHSLSFNSKIFSSFVGYTLAYRLIHFGYVPKNSYMLLTAIFISIFGIFIISKLIKKYY